MTEKGSWEPKAKYSTLISDIQDILANGESRTVRDVYYALEARGKAREYRFVKRAVKKGRRAGYIDPHQIVDASRQTEYVPSMGWDGPEEFVEERIEGVWEDYWRNFWRDQPKYVEVWLEKQSLASVFEPICRENVVRLEATRGDWSDSKVYEATRRLVDKIQAGKDVVILYFGDYNPSGFHAPVSILDTMGYYGIDLSRDFPGSEDGRYYDPEWRMPANFDSGGSLDFERIALNTEHIEKFDLPENPVPSSTDKDAKIKRHFQTYVSDGRDTNVELNALKEYHRDFLEDLLEESIEEHVDQEARDENLQHIRDSMASLEDAVTVNRSVLGGDDD